MQEMKILIHAFSFFFFFLLWARKMTIHIPLPFWGGKEGGGERRLDGL